MKNVFQTLGAIGVIILVIIVWGFIIKYLVSDLEQLKYALSVCFTVGVIVVVSRLFTSYSSNKIKKKRKK